MTFKAKVIAVGIAFILLIVGVGACSSMTTVSQGHVGVVFSKNGGVIKDTLGSGTHLINPISKVTQYPISLDHVKYADISLTTKDGKPLTIDIEYDYKNEPEKITEIFNTWKGMKATDIEQNFLRSRVRESAAAVTSKYTILEIFQNYENIKTEIGDKFTGLVLPHGFIVENFMLGTPNPDESTKNAIDAVVAAQQELQALKVKTDKATEQAKQDKIVAEGKAAAQIAEAQGQAKANQLLQQSITPELLKKMEMEARLKWGWVTIQGAGTAVVTGQ